MSKEALRVAKRLAYVIWQTKYEDDQLYLDEKLPKNESVSSGHPDNINFFYGQFDHVNQAIFKDLVDCLPDSNIKNELHNYIENYNNY